MKRDQSISLTYLPPRVRVVDAYSEKAILNDSNFRTHSLQSVDELENVEKSETEKLILICQDFKSLGKDV